MSKTLIVMRHAKSSWEHAGPDIERPLNKRGRDSAVALGDWLRARDLAPDEILCSAATRTQETAQRLKLAAPVSLNKALYMAPAESLLKYTQRATGDTVLILAHNPGIGEFAERLTRIAPNHPRFFDYPSGATTVFSCDIEEWRELAFDSAAPTDFVVPRELI